MAQDTLTDRMRRLCPPWLANFRLSQRVKALLVAVVVLAFVLQAFRVFLSAFPLMTRGVFDGQPYTLDFGAYYTTAWRLIHNPTQLYTHAAVRGDPPLVFGLPQPGFKYLPFFAFFMLPLLSLNYISALVAWDVFQFLLLPIIGFLLYKALKSFNVILIIVVLWIVLLQPIPFPPAYTISIHDLYTSQSYYFQWGEGSAKVFSTFLIVATYYLSKIRRPHLAGLAYGLAFFDPRFPLYAIPLVLMVSRGQYKKFSVAILATLIAGDAILLYDGLAASFVGMVETSGIGTVFYQYTYIPFYTIVALTAVEGVAFIYKEWHQRSSARGIPTPPQVLR